MRPRQAMACKPASTTSRFGAFVSAAENHIQPAPSTMSAPTIVNKPLVIAPLERAGFLFEVGLDEGLFTARFLGNCVTSHCQIGKGFVCAIKAGHSFFSTRLKNAN